MKFLFIYPDNSGYVPTFSSAIEILSACIKRAGYETDIIHLHDRYGFPVDHDKIYAEVCRINPDAIGITATSYAYMLADDVAGNLKSRGIDKPIVLGGIHATCFPEQLAQSNFDAFSVGEGEISLTEFCRRIDEGGDIYSVKGFLIKKDGRIIDNGPPEVVTDLAELPPNDMSLFDIRKIVPLKNGYFNVNFSRGCPFSCAFCMNKTLKDQFRRSTPVNYCRFQPVEKIFAELMPIIEANIDILKVVDIDDDLFLSDRKRFREFAERFEREIYKPYGIKYVLNGRADSVDDELAELLKRTGCELLMVGAETGDENMRNVILKKKMKDEQLSKAFDSLNRFNVRSLALMMIGIPEETKDTVAATLRMIRRLKPTLIRMTFFEPYVGTDLYDYCKQKDIIAGTKVERDYFTRSNLKFEGITQKELRLYHLLWPWHLNDESLVGDFAAQYRELIEKHSDVREEELDDPALRESILEDDRLMDEKITAAGLPHFRYFNKNVRYYEYVREV